jgi:chromosome partitioning protein
MTELTDALARFDPPVFASAVCQHVAFPESAAQGSTVLELKQESTAAMEIKLLTSELLDSVNTKHNNPEEKAV